MTPEDRLRDLLHAEAPDVVPAGDGLTVIRQRLDSRRSLRSRLTPLAALAAVGGLAVVAAVTVSATDHGSLKQRPARRTIQLHPSPSSTACTVGLCVAPVPVVSPPASTVTTSAAGTPVWPFVSDVQAANWEAQPGDRAWASDPVQVVQHLLTDYLTVPGTAAANAASTADSAVVDVTAAGRRVSQVRLVQVGRDTRGPWSVVSATSANLAITGPAAAAEVSSPLHVTGTVPGVDQSVDLRLLAGGVLAETHAPAGQDQPWTAQLTWSSRAWSVAALVGTTYDGKGDLSSVALVAVRRAGVDSSVPVAGSTLVAIESGHVVTLDAETGQQDRQLSFPPAGATDSGADRGGTDGVVWARTLSDHCTSSILRAGLGHGPAGVTVDAAPRLRRLPSLSAGGRSLGWVEQDCAGGPGTVVVRGPDAKPSTVAASTAAIGDLDVRDDGTAVVALADRVLVVPPGATSVQSGRPLQADPGCTVEAPAWDDQTVVGWERCPYGELLSAWSATGRRTARGSLVPGLSGVRHTSVDEGQVLVQLRDGRVAHYSGGQLVEVPAPKPRSDVDW